MSQFTQEHFLRSMQLTRAVLLLLIDPLYLSVTYLGGGSYKYNRSMVEWIRSEAATLESHKQHIIMYNTETMSIIYYSIYRQIFNMSFPRNFTATD